jgi:hypothetical protein
MPITLPTGAAGRVLALLLAALAALVLWAAAVAPLMDWHARRAEALAHKQALLTRMQALAASLPEWRQAQARAAAQGPARAALLEGTSDAVAAAALQSLVQAMANRAGATVNSMEILPAEPRGPYRRIAVRVIAEGQWPVLLDLLRAIEDAAPRMLIDGLHLRGPDARTFTDAPPISASFSVLGFRAEAKAARP